MARYKVLSEEGSNFANAELDEVVDLDLNEDVERAVVAAGWLEKQSRKAKEG